MRACTCMCTCIYMYVCLSVYSCVCTCMCLGSLHFCILGNMHTFSGWSPQLQFRDCICVCVGLCICVGVFVCVLGGCIPCVINLSYMWYAFMHSCQQFRVITTAAFLESPCRQPGYVPKRKPHYARGHKSIWGCTKKPSSTKQLIHSILYATWTIHIMFMYINLFIQCWDTYWGSRLTTSFSPTCPRGSTSTPRHLKCVWPWLWWIGWVLYL